ncbi:MAG: ATP-dependent Clp protease adaptor ClpS [Flavobacteriales bacterium]|nr:ATP-dependent Clp protease adaptor ClpS [Flavobacteriales bacterium]
MTHRTQFDESLDILEVLNDVSSLIVYNDEVNTFDWVIESLVEICGHDQIQAEQCAFIIHHKGKASVKEGEKRKLKPMRDALIDRGIDAVLEVK